MSCSRSPLEGNEIELLTPLEEVKKLFATPSEAGSETAR